MTMRETMNRMYYNNPLSSLLHLCFALSRRKKLEESNLNLDVNFCKVEKSTLIIMTNGLMVEREYSVSQLVSQ